MEANGLDRLANTLQLTASRVQAKVDAMQEDRLRKLISIGENGQPEALSWECRLPSGEGGERLYNLLRLSWVSLNPPQRMVIQKLSLEFDCSIKQVKSRDPHTPHEYVITPTCRKQSYKHHAHILKLEAKSNNNYIPELTIDEQTINDYLDEFDEQLLEKRIHKTKVLLGIAVAISVISITAIIAFIVLR